MADRNGYIGRAPGDSAVTVARQSFLPTGVTTDFAFAAGYTPGYFDLYINGVKMIEGSDYTSSDGSTFSVLNGGAQNGDVLEGVAYKAFNAASVTNANANFTVGGDLIVSGIATLGSVAAGTSVSLATTAYALEGTPDITVRNVTGVAATFTGVVTYEDVTNVDSVGIVTARSGLNVIGGGLTVTGVSTFFNDLTIGTGSTVGFGSTAFFRDDAKAIFGDGEDLEIYHNGDNSVIHNVGVGTLYIDSAADVVISEDNVTNRRARFIQDGAVELYHNGSKKFETTTNGVLVSGIASMAAVGIGTTNPATALHLYGKVLRIDDANMTMQSTAPQILLKEYGSTYGDESWAIVRDSDSFSIRWKNAAPYALRSTIDSNGDVDKVFLRQSILEANSSGAVITGLTTCDPGGVHGETNIGLSIKGGSDSLNFVHHSLDDFAITNSGSNHRVNIYDASSGIELRYENDANKMVEVDSQGVKSSYIANTTAGSGTALVISGNLIKPQSSTRRLKNNIRNYVGAGLSRIEQMVPRTWEDFSSGDTYSGFVAEELHDIGFESAIVYREYQGGSEIGIGDTYGSMYGNGSTPVTKDGVELDDEVLVVDNFNDRAILAEVVIALKELKAENDSLKSRISALESS